MRHLFGLIVAGLLVLTWAPVHAQDSIPLSERTKTTDCQVNDGLPDPSCTPGAIDPRVTQDTIGATICVSGYTRTVRPSTGITDRIKREQYAAYGLQGLSMSASELD